MLLLFTATVATATEGFHRWMLELENEKLGLSVQAMHLLPLVPYLKAHANGHNIVGQKHATLLGPTCCIRLHGMLVLVASCCYLLDFVMCSLKPVKLLVQHISFVL